MQIVYVVRVVLGLVRVRVIGRILGQHLHRSFTLG